MSDNHTVVVNVDHIKTAIGKNIIHTDINFTVNKGEIIAIIGESGCGKTTLLRAILRLLYPVSGKIFVFDKNVVTASEKELLKVQKRWGVMFQSGALFSSLTVLENILYVLDEYVNLSEASKIDLAKIKIQLVGLDLSAAHKYPSELSGGMKKRAALARAIALDPELILLDEPTAGLDARSAEDLDNLILKLRQDLGLTFIMVTHDLDTLWHVPDRVIFLGEGKVLADQSMVELVKQEHPLIKNYFSGERSQPKGETWKAR